MARFCTRHRPSITVSIAPACSLEFTVSTVPELLELDKAACSCSWAFEVNEGERSKGQEGASITCASSNDVKINLYVVPACDSGFGISRYGDIVGEYSFLFSNNMDLRVGMAKYRAKWSAPTNCMIVPPSAHRQQDDHL